MLVMITAHHMLLLLRIPDPGSQLIRENNHHRFFQMLMPMDWVPIQQLMHEWLDPLILETEI